MKGCAVLIHVLKAYHIYPIVHIFLPDKIHRNILYGKVEWRIHIDAHHGISYIFSNLIILLYPLD